MQQTFAEFFLQSFKYSWSQMYASKKFWSALGVLTMLK